MEIFKILGTIALNNKDANRSLDETTGRAKKSESQISAAIKKIGSAVATYFATDKIISFGKACVETAANVRASMAQFEQTFSVGGEDLTATAKGIIDSVAKDSGILATRLQDSGTKIYAFAKSSGADSAEALSLMETALTAAADTAAYYDVSLENATDTLQSFLKGNFANDAALGVSCTETTRNAAAMELFGQKYQDLTEIQKQQTLLKMVTDSQELSGAMGQASREADGWENVMGNLKEAWRQFQAVIGDPILSNLIPIIQRLTEKVQALPGKLSDLKAKAQAAGDYIATTFKPVIDDIKAAFDKAKDTLQPYIDKLSDYISSGKAAEDITTALKDACEFLAGTYESLKGFISDVVQGFMDAVNWGRQHETAVTLLAVAFGTLATAIGAYAAARAISNAGGIVYLAQLAATAIGVGALTVAETAHTAATTIATAATTAFGAVLSFLTSPITLVVAAIGALIAIGVLLYKNWDTIREKAVEIWGSITSSISDKVSAIKTSVTEKFEAIKRAITDKLQAAKTAVSSIFTNIESAIADKINSARDKVKSGIEKIKSFFNFSWELPKLKLPHFSVSGKFSLNPLSVPKFGIDWYAKGGVLNAPTIFGMNGDTLMGGGEAGKEAVAPIEVLQGYVTEAVSRQNSGIIAVLEKILAALERMDANMGKNLRDALDNTSLSVSGREFGRLVRAVV